MEEIKWRFVKETLLLFTFKGFISSYSFISQQHSIFL